MGYKIENFVYALEAHLKAQLSSYITAVNTEKGDSLLSAFSDDAYFMQTMDERVNNYEKFIIIQVGNPTVNDAARGGLAVTYPVAVYMGFDRGTTDGDAAKKLFRYLDALLSCLLESFSKVALKPFKVLNLDPMALIDIDKSKRVVATGIVLEVSIG